MKLSGYEQFANVFGDITVLQVAEFVIAVIFLILGYNVLKKTLIRHHDKEKERDEKLEKAVTEVEKYPLWHQQSIEIRAQLASEIQALRKTQEVITDKLATMEETNKRRERNKLRDRLLQNHRYYTNPETNPSKSWTRMEAEAFWELFRDYEDADGNGYVHSEVLPDMQRLTVIDVTKK